MTNTISQLMDKAASELCDADIEEIIKFQRKERANFDAGIKPSKKDNSAEQIDSVNLLDRLNMKKKTPDVVVTRRI